MIDTFDFLVGPWALERSITDHRAAIAGSFSGSAIVTADGSIGDEPLRARYLEEGALRFGAHCGPARRTLHWLRRDDGRVMVHFADMRPFVDLDLSAGSWLAEHRCGGDRYEMVTEVVSEHIVRERWRVRGATKSYDADTIWTRRSERAATVDASGLSLRRSPR